MIEGHVKLRLLPSHNLANRESRELSKLQLEHR